MIRSSRPPLIGITGRITTLGPSAPAVFADATADLFIGAYTQMVASAGGLPILLPQMGDPDLVESLVDAVDGLVLSGGADVDPARYGSHLSSRIGPIEPARDEYEMQLLACALERNVPTLAICRGMQLLNVSRGGSLIPELADVGKDSHGLYRYPRQYPWQPVSTVEGSIVRELLGPRVKVNCYHHQAVDRIGDGLLVAATSADGSIEAVEDPDRNVLGVQWHPEWLTEQSALFEWLVDRSSTEISPHRAAAAAAGLSTR